jgi:hypothetical protein
MSVTGSDTLTGYSHNFAWGVLELDSAQSLTLQDGNTAPGGALYINQLILANGLPQIGSITGNGLNIYYNATDPLNTYLAGQTYPLTNGGFLIGATPEPTTEFLALASATILLRRRRANSRSTAAATVPPST